jgi:hypothetical protein
MGCPDCGFMYLHPLCTRIHGLMPSDRFIFTYEAEIYLWQAINMNSENKKKLQGRFIKPSSLLYSPSAAQIVHVSYTPL